MSQKKNNPIYLIAFGAIAIFLVYLVFIKTDTNSTTKLKPASKAEKVKLVDNKATPSLDTGEKKLKIDTVDIKVQLALNTIDGLLDDAYATKIKNERNSILKIVKGKLDSTFKATEHPYINVLYGDYFMLKALYKEAEKAYGQAINDLGLTKRLEENYYGALFNSAQVYYTEKNKKTAIEHMNKYVEHNNTDQEAVGALYRWSVNYAVELLQTEKNEDAYSMLTNIKQYAPDEYLVNYNLGIAESRTQRVEDAIISFKKCLHLNPEDDDGAKTYLYMLYKNMGKEAEAAKYFVAPKEIDISN